MMRKQILVSYAELLDIDICIIILLVGFGVVQPKPGEVYIFRFLNYQLLHLFDAGPLRSRAAKAIGFIGDMINYSTANAPLQKELEAGKPNMPSVVINLHDIVEMPQHLSGYVSFSSLEMPGCEIITFWLFVSFPCLFFLFCLLSSCF